MRAPPPTAISAGRPKATAGSPGSGPTWSRSSAAPSPEAPSRQRLLYGRRTGHRLKPGHKRLLDQELPEIRIDLEGRQRLEPADLFDPPRPLWLEIGFGAGEHLAAMAARHPEIGCIGCEPFVTGVAKLLSARAALGLDNLRVVVDDARLLLDLLPGGSLERIYVLFPDPWPKTRHHKRRIVNPTTAAAFARLLRPGGEVRLATDDLGYSGAMLRCMTGRPEFEWTAERARDWRRRPVEEVATRYERKAALAGRPCRYFRFRRLAAGPESP